MRINKLLIKNVQLEGNPVDIYIEGDTIMQVAPQIEAEANTLIDGTDKAVIPGLVNGHTHAAMTLFRGYADDMKLMPWLEQKIWPNEAKLTREDVYWGAKLACLEMIKSGTTTFFDMYQRPYVTADAVEEMDAHYGRTQFTLRRGDIKNGLSWAIRTPFQSGMKFFEKENYLTNDDGTIKTQESDYASDPNKWKKLQTDF